MNRSGLKGQTALSAYIYAVANPVNGLVDIEERYMQGVSVSPAALKRRSRILERQILAGSGRIMERSAGFKFAKKHSAHWKEELSCFSNTFFISIYFV